MFYCRDEIVFESTDVIVTVPGPWHCAGWLTGRAEPWLITLLSKEDSLL